MKTWKKVLLLIAILLLAIGATLTQLAHRRGDSYLANLSFGVSGNYGYDQKGYTVCRSGEADCAAEDVRALSLDWNAGSVTVERDPDALKLIEENIRQSAQQDSLLRGRRYRQAGRLCHKMRQTAMPSGMHRRSAVRHRVRLQIKKQRSQLPLLPEQPSSPLHTSVPGIPVPLQQA